MTLNSEKTYSVNNKLGKFFNKFLKDFGLDGEKNVRTERFEFNPKSSDFTFFDAEKGNVKIWWDSVPFDHAFSNVNLDENQLNQILKLCASAV